MPSYLMHVYVCADHDIRIGKKLLLFTIDERGNANQTAFDPHKLYDMQK